MALVPIGNNMSIDTDDLEQAEYHYYCKAKTIGRYDIANKILKGDILAEDIERNENHKFDCLVDDATYIMLKLAYNNRKVEA